MKTKYIKAIAILIALTISCTKEVHHDHPTAMGRLVGIDMHADGSYKFLYKNNQLAAIIHQEGGGTCRYKFVRYEDQKVTVQEEGEANEFHTYILNEHGYAISCEVKTTTQTTTAQFSYSTDDYLTKIMINMSDGIQQMIEIAYDSDHNISKVTQTSSPGEEDEDVDEYYFTYGSDVNKGGKTNMPYVVDAMDVLFVSYYAGLLGKDPALLHTRVKSNWIAPEYSYTFDTRGYITSIIADHGISKEVWNYSFE